MLLRLLLLFCYCGVFFAAVECLFDEYIASDSCAAFVCFLLVNFRRVCEKFGIGVGYNTCM